MNRILPIMSEMLLIENATLKIMTDKLCYDRNLYLTVAVTAFT